MKKITSTIIFLSMSMLAMAQQNNQQTFEFSDFYTRISAGFSGMQIYSNVDETKYDTDLFAPGGTVGLTYGRKLVEELDHKGATYMEIGAELAYNTGANVTDYDAETRINIMSAIVPISIGYKKLLTPQNYCMLFYGGISPKVNMLANMQYQVKGYDQKIEKDLLSVDDMGEEYTAERFQFGLHIGIGFEFDNIYVHYKCHADLMPFQSYDYLDKAVQTRAVSHTLCISYILGK